MDVHAEPAAPPTWAGRLGGEIVGDRWRFDDPHRPGEPETRWGVLWNLMLGEVVAVQIVDGEPGRVLLLATIPAELRPRTLGVLQRTRDREMSGPHGLVVLAGAIDGFCEAVPGWSETGGASLRRRFSRQPE